MIVLRPETALPTRDLRSSSAASAAAAGRAHAHAHARAFAWALAGAREGEHGAKRKTQRFRRWRQ
jgi:hypothetical protein